MRQFRRLVRSQRLPSLVDFSNNLSIDKRELSIADDVFPGKRVFLENLTLDYRELTPFRSTYLE
jgi:hypothetical protein